MNALATVAACWLAAGVLASSVAWAGSAPEPAATPPAPCAEFALEVVDPGPDNVGQHASLQLDPDGHLVVAYYNATAGDLRVAVKNTSWSISTVDALRDVGRYASLAIDASGRRNISYYDATEGALKYAGWVTPSWAMSVEQVTSGGNDRGTHASLTKAPSGNLAVAFYDATTGDLNYGVQSGGWSISTIDPLRDVGRYASLAIDASGQRNFSYYDATEGALKYAGWVTPAWDVSLEQVTSGGNDRGTHASLTKEPLGNLAVAFYDATTGDLLHGVKNGVWSVSTMDALRDVGRYASLAIDASGRKNATYYDATEGALRYAGWITPAWSVAIEQATSGLNDVGQYASAAMDMHHNLNVTYYDNTVGRLMLARRVFVPNPAWVQQEIDDGGDVGRYCSLKFADDGPYHTSLRLSYFDAANTALKFAWCVPETLTAVEDSVPTSSVPRQFVLRGNVPNPFNPTTNVSFDVPQAAVVRLVIYDPAGRSVRTLVDGELPAGTHSLKWDGSDENGRSVASGVYLCRMEAGAFRETRRMTLVR